MTISAHPATETAPALDSSWRAFTASRVATLAAYALVVGVAADALLRDGPGTLGAALWALVAGRVGVACLRRLGRAVPLAAEAWLAVAALVTAAAAWRDAEVLQVVDFAAAFGALVVAAALIARRAPLGTRLLRELLSDVRHVVTRVAGGAAPILVPLTRLLARGTPFGARTRDAVRLTLLAGIPVLVFGALLAGGDPLFASYVALPSLDLGEVLSHVVVTGVFTWVATGWLRAALDDAPDAGTSTLTLPSRDVLVVLGAVTLLFGAFLAAQLGWLVGGEAFLRARTGLTAAAYARRGFFEMIAVTTLVVPLLLATRAALPAADRDAARRHTRWSLALLALLALMLASSVARLVLYVLLFGLTSDRTYPLVLLAWLAGVLAWLVTTVLRDRPRPFVAGVLWSGTAVLLALHVVPVDRLIARANVARANVARASRGPDAPALDVLHLTQLGGVAADVAVAAVLAPPGVVDDVQARCEGARTLLRRWGDPPRGGDGAWAWRAWNAGDRQGRAAVRAHAASLRQLTTTSCGGSS